MRSDRLQSGFSASTYRRASDPALPSLTAAPFLPASLDRSLPHHSPIGERDGRLRHIPRAMVVCAIYPHAAVVCAINPGSPFWLPRSAGRMECGRGRRATDRAWTPLDRIRTPLDVTWTPLDRTWTPHDRIQWTPLDRIRTPRDRIRTPLEISEPWLWQRTKRRSGAGARRPLGDMDLAAWAKGRRSLGDTDPAAWTIRTPQPALK
ncbi:hypothetical protein BD626DRAFT_528339 [Schizophyllum amplum]|uniref:Uncharacterized protein n=1 Tax=Schizophyllum amplum TaxID=97359 RepID=A0A550BS17_9AGAR|nr:hypothetical protein BD626DRAFT_528339 [Auriculariopsis ampla]